MRSSELDFENIINEGLKKPKDINEKIGRQIKTKKDLAEALGLPEPTLSRYIKVDRSVDIEWIDKISEYLEIDKEKLYEAYVKSAIMNRKKPPLKMLEVGAVAASVTAWAMANPFLYIGGFITGPLALTLGGAAAIGMGIKKAKDMTKENSEIEEAISQSNESIEAVQKVNKELENKIADLTAQLEAMKEELSKRK